MALAVLALMGVLSFSLRVRPKADSRLQAGLTASSLLNRAVRRLRQQFDVPVDVTRQLVPDPLNPDGRYEYEVVNTMVTPPDLRRVEVRVYWSDAQGSQQLDLFTLVARDG